MHWRLLHLVLLLAVWPTVLAGAGMDVALQVTLANPPVDAPLSLALTEGSPLGRAAAADGTAIVITLPATAFVGGTVNLLLTAPGGTVTTISHVLDAGDVAAGMVTVATGISPLAADGAYGTAGSITAPDATSSAITVGPSFIIDPVPPTPPDVGIAGIVGDGAAVASGGTTFDRRPRISGSATPGSTIRLLANGVLIGTAIAAGDGTWTVTLSADLPLHWQTIIAEATFAGVSSRSAEYDIDVLSEERELDASGCGAGSWIALLLVAALSFALRPGRRSLLLLLALAPLIGVHAADVDAPPDTLSLSAVVWPSADASRSTRDGEGIADVSDPGATLRFDLGWWTERIRPSAKPALGFGVGYWRSFSELTPARPADASFRVHQNNLPLSALLRWRPLDRGAWGCDAQIAAGIGPVLAQVDGSTPAGEFADALGFGYVLDGSLAVEPWVRIGTGSIVGASVRGVLARTDVRFEDRSPGEEADSYRAVQVVHGIAWGVFAAWTW